MCDKPHQYEYPQIEQTFHHMQNSYADGYVVIKQAVATVLHQLRYVIQHLYHNIMSSHAECNSTYVTLFCDVICYLNKYETLIWQKHTRHCHTSAPDNELAKFQDSICDMKECIHALLPTQHASVLQVIQNNIICIEQTGLLARHALYHVIQFIQDI